MELRNHTRRIPRPLALKPAFEMLRPRRQSKLVYSRLFAGYKYQFCSAKFARPSFFACLSQVKLARAYLGQLPSSLPRDVGAAERLYRQAIASPWDAILFINTHAHLAAASPPPRINALSRPACLPAFPPPGMRPIDLYNDQHVDGQSAYAGDIC